MITHRISAETWAKQAGIASTSITRFLKHGYPVPKTATLQRLAFAVNITPPGEALLRSVQSLVDVPILLPHVLVQSGKQVAMDGAVEWTRVPAKFANTYGVRINTPYAVLAGILPNDLVLVDDALEIRPGDLVAVALPGGDVGALKVQPPYLVHAGTEPGPAPILQADANVLGVIVQVQREIARPR